MKVLKYIVLAILIIGVSTVCGQQINIPRIDQMPNFPQPYQMRDWKKVSLGYDSLVFNPTLSGQYLPLYWEDGNSVNYPSHNRFGLHTVVGTPYPNNAEAINVMPAVVGASLCGVDKSAQNGKNYVLMCEEFFNRRPEENVYLNGFITSSGSDWWYDTMPNIFFYQLYDMYPNTGDFNFQFTSVADQWRRAEVALGGRLTPWHAPYFNYRAFKLSTMTPKSSGVVEPEAAGAIGWIQYMAYLETGDQNYRIGAEWAMEFLEGWNTNPSYELQLPYGVYAAARMNAELFTNYDIEKMVNWCFDVGMLRNWGATLGNWGGYDCYGLIGEAHGNDYAFAMNGYEQAGSLVPMVRYDDRFARAIGKWVLNVANASRLFYPNFLPDSLQDSEVWAHQYDPKSYIAHESMRELWQGLSPYATGDAIAGGWGATNLALYGSSHVGILGSIIDTTNVEGILKLDVLKTDYFHQAAYPSYLVYNPYALSKTIELNVGSAAVDIYDAVENSFLSIGVSGIVNITINPDDARLLVYVPAGAQLSNNYHQLLADGVIIDYRSANAVSNYPPRIKALAGKKEILFINESTAIYCSAGDRESSSLNYQWHTSNGIISGNGSAVAYTAPDSGGISRIRCIVNDGSALEDTAFLDIEIVSNRAPSIVTLISSEESVNINENLQLECNAVDPDGDTLVYEWFAVAGNFVNPQQNKITWQAPSNEGYNWLKCRITDPSGADDLDSIAVVVGHLVGHYPFNGNADDVSTFSNHGIVNGASLTTDRFGNANSAYSFDGVDDMVRIPNHPTINQQSEITVNFWMKVGQFYSREAYPISHGNWENRWKVSITNNRIRWTIKTDTSANSGIHDLDSQQLLVLDAWYNVSCVYRNNEMSIYLNGIFDHADSWNGKLNQVGIDLTIGQVLPNNSSYNFNGSIDDVRIYNRALSAVEIQNLYTKIENLNHTNLPATIQLQQNYPNPFNPTTTISYQIPKKADIELAVFDNNGREVEALYKGIQQAGYYRKEWQANGFASGVYFVRLKTNGFAAVRKMLLLR